MGAMDRYFYVVIVKVVENDGETYLRRGPEREETRLEIGAALKELGKAKVVSLLREALKHAESK
jgi:hypothetical protein